MKSRRCEKWRSRLDRSSSPACFLGGVSWRCTCIQSRLSTYCTSVGYHPPWPTRCCPYSEFYTSCSLNEELVGNSLLVENLLPLALVVDPFMRVIFASRRARLPIVPDLAIGLASLILPLRFCIPFFQRFIPYLIRLCWWHGKSKGQ